MKAFTIVVGISSIGEFVIVLLQACNVQMSGVFGVLASASFWLLPILTLALGSLIGWTVRKNINDKQIASPKAEHKAAADDIERKLGMTVDGAAEKLDGRPCESESAMQQFDTLGKDQQNRVVECFKKEESGSRLEYCYNDPTNESLVAAGVFTRHKSDFDPDLTFYMLTREWRCIVREYLKTAKEDKDAHDRFTLRGEQALDFIRSLPENQRAFLRKIYDDGGSIETDPFDAELDAMATYGLVLRPAVFTPGVAAKWTLPPNINCIIRDYPDVLGKPVDQNPHGFSKLALQAWNLMEDSDRRSLSLLRGASLHSGSEPKHPLILETDGSLVDIGIDQNQLKRLIALGVLEKYPERALIPFRKTDGMKPLAGGVSVLGDSALLELADGIYETKGCTARFCVPGDFASPPMQCVDLGLYEYTPVGQELIRAMETKKSPGFKRYLDRAYAKERDAERPMTEWISEV